MIRAPRRAWLVLAPLLGCGARSSLPCGDVDCAADPAAQAAERCNGQLDAPPPCEGTGLVWTSTDDCIDDGGETTSGDLLEVWCVDGIARFCLSGEACPWRSGTATGDASTCSESGLSSTYMANTVGGCPGWEGYNVFCCAAEGRIGVAK